MKCVYKKRRRYNLINNILLSIIMFLTLTIDFYFGYRSGSNEFLGYFERCIDQEKNFDHFVVKNYTRYICDRTDGVRSCEEFHE